MINVEFVRLEDSECDGPYFTAQISEGAGSSRYLLLEEGTAKALDELVDSEPLYLVIYLGNGKNFYCRAREKIPSSDGGSKFILEEIPPPPGGLAW